MMALVVAGAAGVGVASVATAGATTKVTSAPRLGFSHEVVVDEQRSGFEPDIQVGPKDTLYTSVPNGSSSTTSWVWTSTDHGNSFHLVAGNAIGRTTTCPQGGGDTEQALDKKGDLFFSDLQNLSNLTNSVSTDGGKTFTTTCVGATNTPVDRMWYGVHGNLGDPDFRIYEEYDAVLSAAQNAPSNQLVLEASNDGLTWYPVANSSPTNDCLGGGTANCVTDDEGISGNMVIAPNGDVLLAHTTSDSSQIVVSRGRVTGTFPALTARWTHTIINTDLCPDTLQANTADLGKSEVCGAANFATIAEDKAGHFYVMFASNKQTDEKISGSPEVVPSGPYEVFVASSADGVHWNKPVQVSTTGSNAFPWITAGADGRVAAAWYSTNETRENPANGIDGQLNQSVQPDPKGYLFDELTHAEFNIQVGESLDAMSAHPHYSVTTVSEHPIKFGPICTVGTTCEVTQGDRSLGDFMQVNYDARGALVLSYVNDTSGYFAVGPTGAVADSGPNVVVRQVSGPGLLGGQIHGSAGGPGVALNAVGDPVGDDEFSALSQLLPAGPNLDLTGASLAEDAKGLVATLKVKSLSSLRVTPTAGGTTGEWMLRFTTYDPGMNGNGNIYYTGMESVAGSAPRFFSGEPVRTKELTAFNATTSVPGSYDAKTGTITIHLPFSSLVAADRKKGTKLYSATAFTATTLGTLAALPESVFNQTDATTPFDFVLPRSAPAHQPVLPVGGSSKSSSGGRAGGSLATTGLPVGVPILALLLTLGAFGVRRYRRPHRG
jgi:hypothetical protein